MIKSYLHYPALKDYQGQIDSVYNIPNKYFVIYNAAENPVIEKTISPDVPKFIFQLYTINGTIPVELFMTPKLDYNETFLMMILNKDYRNGTYVAKTKKSFNIKIYDNPTFYLLTVYENDFIQENYKLLQQIIIDKGSYSLTYLLPFDLGA